MNLRKSIIILIIAILCVMPIFFIIYAKFLHSNPNEQIASEDTLAQQSKKEEINEEELINNFDNIFLNKIDYQQKNINNINKKDNTKELVYTSYELSEQIENKYSISAKIPAININNSYANKINTEIENTFKNKISTIIAEASDTSIQLYDVKYMSYINANVLSLVIQATLKSGNSAQRVLVKTYNYNLTSNEQVSLEQILSARNISKNHASKKIQETIKKADNFSQSLKDLGYSDVYTRDLNSSIYNIENTSTFFLGKDAILYVIYPYGNSNITSEMDLIVF